MEDLTEEERARNIVKRLCDLDVTLWNTVGVKFITEQIRAAVLDHIKSHDYPRDRD